MSASNYTAATEIAGELTRRIETITAGIGARVRRGRLSVTSDDVPCTTIIEGADKVQRSASRQSTVAHVEQQYAIVALVACDPEHPNDAAHEAIRQIKRAVFAGDATWGGKVRSVLYKGRQIAPRADGVPTVQATVEIAVEYAESLAEIIQSDI